ncbi:MAG: ATP-grasp domain-containing protein [Gemmatimonadales bacterium]
MVLRRVGHAGPVPSRALTTLPAYAPAPIVLATCRLKPSLTPGDTHLASALARAGATVTATPWDAVSSTAEEIRVVCLRSTWDYHLRWNEFRTWIAGFGGRNGRLWNPAETVLWNADKIYLRELEEAGIALPRTRWFEPGERPDCDGMLREWRLARAVLKPRVSATAFGTHLISAEHDLRGEDWAELEASGCLLQAFVAEIESRGEISLVYLDGDFSHAVRKRPASGDFRVQTDFGGRLERERAASGVRAFGDAVLAAAARPWLYARVDLVETDHGPVLMELELIEPDLFLDAAAAERLASALLARAGRAAA